MTAQNGRQKPGRGRGRQISVGWSTIWVLPLWILALVALAYFLRSTRELFVPIVLAVLIAYALAPVVGWLERWRVPRLAGSTVVVGMLVGIGAWAAWSLSDDFQQAARQLPAQIREFREQFETTRSDGTMQGLRQALGEVQQLATAEGEASPMGAEQQAGGQASAQAAGGGGAQGGPSSLVAQYMWQGSMGVVSVAGYVTVITFLVFFLLAGAPAARGRLIALSGEVLASRGAGADVLDEITSQIQRFLLVRLFTAVAVGVATWAVLLMFGAPAPALWGVAAGVLNSVPFFGPLIVSAGLALVGLFSGGFAMALKLSGSALVITSLEGWLLTPVLLGRAARMNTLSVFLGLLVWSWVWGVWGTLLAVPMMSTIKVVCDHVRPLHPVSKLLEE